MILEGGAGLNDDFDSLKDGDRIELFPNGLNPLHTKPFIATYSGGYFYAEKSDPMDGPDYYWRDVGLYNDGFKMLSPQRGGDRDG